MRIIVGVSLAVLLLLPDGAEAQRRGRYNPYSFAPYVGVYKDAYDQAADGSDVGYMFGFKAGYRESERLSLHLNLGYAQANDVASRGITSPIFDNQWVLLTGGGDFALVPGNTAIALGVDAGVGWRRTRLDEPEGAVGGSSDGWGAYEVVAPGLTVRHHFSQRTAFWVSVQDYIFEVFDSTAKHSPAFTLGLSFR